MTPKHATSPFQLARHGRQYRPPWRPHIPGAAWRNEAISSIASSSLRKWKTASGYHRHSLAETLMYRLKMLPGRELAAQAIAAQATEVVVRVSVLNCMTALARPHSVRMTKIQSGIEQIVVRLNLRNNARPKPLHAARTEEH